MNFRSRVLWHIGLRVMTVAILGNVSAEESRDKSESSPLELAREEFKEAYFAWDLSMMEASAESLSTLVEEYPACPEALYWHCVARVHGLLYRKADANLNLRTSQIDPVIDILREARSRQPEEAEYHALLGILYGLRIDASPLSAIIHGGRFKSSFKTAFELAPENPRVHYLFAQTLINGPANMGGQPRALEVLLKAAALYQREASGSAKRFWGRAETHFFAGKIYLRDGENDKGAAEFSEAVRIHPGYGDVIEKARKSL